MPFGVNIVEKPAGPSRAFLQLPRETWAFRNTWISCCCEFSQIKEVPVIP